MLIGFDLDKVFIDTPPLVPTSIIQKLYKKKSNGTLLYRIPSKPEQIFRRITHISPLRPPIHKNLETLKKISKEKNTLYLISSRYSFLKQPTNNLIKKHKLDTIFETLYFNYNDEQPHVFKNTVLKKLHLDMYIDDDLSLLQYVAKDNPKTSFYWLKTDAQKDYLKLHPVLRANVIPINNLTELFAKI